VDVLALWSLGVVLVGQATKGVTETDIWGHMAIGLDMLQARQLLRVDPYSFTNDILWVNHEWLWDLLTAAIYRSSGLTGVLVVRAILIGLVLWVVYRASARLPTWVRGLALGAVALVCSAQWMSTRPQLATLPLYAVVLLKPSAPWLPLLFALWANVHGGWMIGFGAVLAYTVLHPSLRQSIIAAACVGATLVNPYGVHLWMALADAVFRGWADVGEWAPIWSRAAGLAALWIWIAAVVLVLLLSRHVTAGLWPWAWTIVTFVAAAQSRRLMALAAVTAAVLLLPKWRTPSPHAAVGWTAARRAVAAGVIAGACAVALTFVVPTRSCFPPTHHWRAPEPDAVAFIRDADLRGRALVHFDFGEYVIFHLRDRLKVSIDNRRETVYSDTVVQDHIRFYAGQDPAYPERLQADLVWLPRSLDAVTNALEERGWFRRFDGPNTVILHRSRGAVVHGRPSVGTPCFPHP
jgi:hypothetical protein